MFFLLTKPEFEDPTFVFNCYKLIYPRYFTIFYAKIICNSCFYSIYMHYQSIVMNLCIGQYCSICSHLQVWVLFLKGIYFMCFVILFLLWTHTYWNFIYEIWRPSLKWISSERFGFASKKCPLELPTWNHFKKKNVTFDLREGNIDRNIDSRNSCFTASLLRPLVSVQVFQKSNAQMGLDV